MRAFRFLNVAILSALVATSAALYAQDEKPQEDKPKQEEPKKQDEARPAEKQDETKPAGKQDEMKAPRQDEAKPSRQDQNQQDKNQQKEMEKRSGQENQRPEENRNRQEAAQPGRQEAGQQEHGRPAGKGGHIPDDKFHAQFGRGHSFHPSRPQVVNGQPQFEYGGYSFVMVDPWPAEWAYTDDCYIDYIDGEYYLIDLLHPGMRIALFVVL
ncbi:MAG TPA: hypothetical protein VGM18_20965 [Candidatus Sulfotelmatobacter sp.]|jgi:hypothetical protein